MKKYYLQICSLLLLLVCFKSSDGQVKTIFPTGNEPRIIKTQGTDKNQNVQCGLLDKAGNLWFGTTGEGVYRYDGRSFSNFTEKDGLCSNSVWSILEDRTGKIWFGTDAGPCRYDPSAAQPRFTPIPISVKRTINFSQVNSPNNNAWPKNRVMSMLQDRTGKIWFGTGDGVYHYDGKSFTRFLDNDGVINKNGLHLKGAENMLEDKDGNIWFGGRSWDNEGVCRFDGRSITSFKPDAEPWVRPLLEDRSGNIWFGSKEPLCLPL